jgi:hypothetical protein
MPTALFPASPMVQTPPLPDAPAAAPNEVSVLDGKPDTASQSGKENFLAALQALLAWNLGGTGVSGEPPTPPAHGARERFGAEDLPKGLTKPVVAGSETGADASAEALGEEETADAAGLDGLGDAGHGLPHLLWSAMLLGGAGTEAAEEELGNGRWALPQILSALRAWTGREGSTEGVSSLAEATIPSGPGILTEPGAAVQVAVEGERFQVPLLPQNEMKPIDVIGRFLVEMKPADPARALLSDAKAANPDAAPKNDVIRDEGRHPASVKSALGEPAPKEGAPSFSLDRGEAFLPEGGSEPDLAVKENGSAAPLRASGPERGEGSGPAVRTSEWPTLAAGPGLTAVPGADQEAKPETGAKTATMENPLDLEAIPSEAQEHPGDADGGAESGSGRESAKGDPGFGAVRSDAAETLSGANSLKRGGEAFPKALHPELVDRIVERAVLGVREGQREIRIDLKPEFLGQVRLHISTDHQQVMVRMVAENSVAKEIIESNMPQLRAALQNQGLEIGKFDISLAQHFGQQGTGYQPHSFSGGIVPGGGEETGPPPIEEDLRAQRTAAGQPGESIDFFA